jgi:hypothetical protein
VKRFHQFILIGSLLLSWLAMTVVHEFGHVVGAWLTGGTVAKVVGSSAAPVWHTCCVVEILLRSLFFQRTFR